MANSSSTTLSTQQSEILKQDDAVGSSHVYSTVSPDLVNALSAALATQQSETLMPNDAASGVTEATIISPNLSDSPFNGAENNTGVP